MKFAIFKILIFHKSEKNKKQLEADYHELEERFNEQQTVMNKALNDKKKYESDSFVISEELNEARFELKNLEDRVKNK